MGDEITTVNMPGHSTFCESKKEDTAKERETQALMARAHSNSSRPAQSFEEPGLVFSSAYERTVGMRTVGMLHRSAYGGGFGMSPAGPAAVYSNREKDLDACVDCYERKMSPVLKKMMGLQGVSKDFFRGDPERWFWCDNCGCNINVGSGPPTKLHMLLLLKPQLDDAFARGALAEVDALVAAAASAPWSSTPEALQAELERGKMGSALAARAVEALQRGAATSSALPETAPRTGFVFPAQPPVQFSSQHSTLMASASAFPPTFMINSSAVRPGCAGDGSANSFCFGMAHRSSYAPASGDGRDAGFNWRDSMGGQGGGRGGRGGQGN